MNVTIDKNNFIVFYNSDNKFCRAKFLKDTYIMSTEISSLNIDMDASMLKITIGNGNHYRDFDEIHIVNSDDIFLLKINSGQF